MLSCTSNKYIIKRTVTHPTKSFALDSVPMRSLYWKINFVPAKGMANDIINFSIINHHYFK